MDTYTKITNVRVGSEAEIQRDNARINLIQIADRPPSAIADCQLDTRNPAVAGFRTFESGWKLNLSLSNNGSRKSHLS